MAGFETTAPCHLSSNQVDNLLLHVFNDDGKQEREDQEKPALSGRTVMIPITGQAFCLGQLKKVAVP